MRGVCVYKRDRVTSDQRCKVHAYINACILILCAYVHFYYIHVYDFFDTPLVALDVLIHMSVKFGHHLDLF